MRACQLVLQLVLQQKRDVFPRETTCPLHLLSVWSVRPAPGRLLIGIHDDGQSRRSQPRPKRSSWGVWEAKEASRCPECVVSGRKMTTLDDEDGHPARLTSMIGGE